MKKLQRWRTSYVSIRYH